jgi:hypothetical protein
VVNHVEPEGALSGARILVVEDDFLISTELDTILADAGATVLGPFRTLAQAERAIEDNNVSAAILDFRLGDTAARRAAAPSRHSVRVLHRPGEHGANRNRLPGRKNHRQAVPKPHHRRRAGGCAALALSFRTPRSGDPESITTNAGVMDSRFLASLGPGMT